MSAAPRIDGPGRITQSLIDANPTQIMAVYIVKETDGTESALTCWTQMSAERMAWMLKILQRDVDAEL